MAVISAPGTRSVGSQVGRGLGIGMSAVAALVLGGVAVAYGAAPATQAWYRVVGDPGVTLADGATLDAMPARSVELTLETVPVDVTALSSAFGGAARELTTAADLAASGADASAEDLVALRFFAVPGGTVRTVRDVVPGAIASVSFDSTAGGPGTGRASTPAEREQVLRRAIDGLGLTSAGSGVGYELVEQVEDGSVSVTAIPTLGGMACESCGIPRTGATWATDGTLRSMTLWALRAANAKPVTTISATEAFDLLRHHGEDAMVGAGGPVVRAELNPAVTQPGLSIPASWIFYDADGETVGQVTAQPGRRAVVDDTSPATVTVG